MDSTTRVHNWLKTVPRVEGEAALVEDGKITPEGIEYAFSCAEIRRAAPWKTTVLSTSTGDAGFSRYCMFPITDTVSYEMFKQHESSIWSAAHLEFEKDAAKFPTLPPRFKEIYKDFLGFFAPGDGIISGQVNQFVAEAETPEQLAFLQVQLFMEQVHAETYGLAISNVIPDPKERAETFMTIENLPCVMAKGIFVNKWLNSNATLGKRYLAGALSEGVFFVSLFALIFYFRRKNVFETFVTANQWISRDETLHRDYNCLMAKRYGGFTQEEAYDLVREAVEIEIEHMRYILRTPIETREIDEAAGLTFESIEGYIKTLADHVLSKSGVAPLYNVDVNLPWLLDLSSGVSKQNFYEGQVTSYRQYSKVEAIMKSTVNVASKQDDEEEEDF